MGVDILNESGVPADERELSALASYCLKALRIHPQSELSIRLADVGAMEALHVRYLDEPGPTDVLSFPMDELRPGSDDEPSEEGLLGDVVLCPQVAASQAIEAGHPLEAELAMLTVHGILHLLGFDHAEPEEKAQMFGLQGELLAGWRAATEQASP